jgi:hypothetical protein
MNESTINEVAFLVKRRNIDMFVHSLAYSKIFFIHLVLYMMHYNHFRKVF